MSITPPSIIPVSVDYTGRDYYAIRAELITRIQDRIPEWTASDPADFGVALVEAFAYMGDIISYYIDRNANENYISTAVQRSSVLNIANIYGYTPVSYRQASVTLTYTNTSANDYTVPAGTIGPDTPSSEDPPVETPESKGSAPALGISLAGSGEPPNILSGFDFDFKTGLGTPSV